MMFDIIYTWLSHVITWLSHDPCVEELHDADTKPGHDHQVLIDQLFLPQRSHLAKAGGNRINGEGRVNEWCRSGEGVVNER